MADVHQHLDERSLAMAEAKQLSATAMNFRGRSLKVRKGKHALAANIVKVVSLYDTIEGSQGAWEVQGRKLPPLQGGQQKRHASVVVGENSQNSISP